MAMVSCAASKDALTSSTLGYAFGRPRATRTPRGAELDTPDAMASFGAQKGCLSGQRRDLEEPCTPAQPGSAHKRSDEHGRVSRPDRIVEARPPRRTRSSCPWRLACCQGAS